MTLFSGRNNCFYPIDHVSRQYDGVQQQTQSLAMGGILKKLLFGLKQVIRRVYCDGNCLGLLLWTAMNASHPYVSLWHYSPFGRRDGAMYIL
jgi:hypothetical protein